MKTVALFLAAALSCTCVHAQSASGQGVEVKKQTANSAAQRVVETPKTRQNENNQRITDGLNTRRGTPDKRPRDEYGAPRTEPVKGQGTNSSTDAMRAADKKD